MIQYSISILDDLQTVLIKLSIGIVSRSFIGSVMKSTRTAFFLVIACCLPIFATSLGAQLHTFPDRPEFAYFLSPKPSQQFQYLVRYQTLFSRQLGKEKGFFIILPEDFFQSPGTRYPLLFLLHGYNFHRTGMWWTVHSPEKAMKLLSEVKEEEYHWLFHEAIALIAYAMTDPKNRTYRDLEKSLEMRFQELARNGGLNKGDDDPKEIARSIVSHNLHPDKDPNDSFRPIQKMIIVLPDGDNGFYTDENEGKRLFPETKSLGGFDDFYAGEAFNYSLLPFLSMKPGSIGKHESYFLELVRYVESQSSYRERVLAKRGVGGFSMGAFGAVKLGLKYPDLFRSVSSQSGLLDPGLLQNKWMLKMVIPEFLEIFGRLEPLQPPSSSSLDFKHIHANNPVILIEKRGINRLPEWLYFDYGSKEGFGVIKEGNQLVEKKLGEGSHEIPAQLFNGKSGHNFQFWRSRSAIVLQHHSDVLRREMAMTR